MLGAQASYSGWSATNANLTKGVTGPRAGHDVRAGAIPAWHIGCVDMPPAVLGEHELRIRILGRPEKDEQQEDHHRLLSALATVGSPSASKTCPAIAPCRRVRLSPDQPVCRHPPERKAGLSRVHGRRDDQTSTSTTYGPCREARRSSWSQRARSGGMKGFAVRLLRLLATWFWRVDASLGGDARPHRGQQFSAAHPVRLGLVAGAAVGGILILISLVGVVMGRGQAFAPSSVLFCLGVAAFAGMSMMGICYVERWRQRHYGHYPPDIPG